MMLQSRKYHLLVTEGFSKVPSSPASDGFLVKLQQFVSSKMLNLTIMIHSSATTFGCFKIMCALTVLPCPEITQTFLQYEQQLQQDFFDLISCKNQRQYSQVSLVLS